MKSILATNRNKKMHHYQIDESHWRSLSDWCLAHFKMGEMGRDRGRETIYQWTSTLDCVGQKRYDYEARFLAHTISIGLRLVTGKI